MYSHYSFNDSIILYHIERIYNDELYICSYRCIYDNCIVSTTDELTPSQFRQTLMKWARIVHTATVVIGIRADKKNLFHSGTVSNQKPATNCILSKKNQQTLHLVIWYIVTLKALNLCHPHYAWNWICTEKCNDHYHSLLLTISKTKYILL